MEIMRLQNTTDLLDPEATLCVRVQEIVQEQRNGLCSQATAHLALKEVVEALCGQPI